MDKVWLVNKVVTDDATYSVALTVGVCTSEEKANAMAIRLMDDYPDDEFYVSDAVNLDTTFSE